MNGILVALAAFTVLSFTTGHAQDVPSCRTVRGSGASILQKCGDTLRSFSLVTSDMRGRIVSDVHGHRFYFACRLTPNNGLLEALRGRKSEEVNYSCRTEPSISGFFFDPTDWQSSRKDEQAILTTLANYPYNSGIISDRGASALKVNCAAFDTSVGDLPAKATCFGGSGMKMDAIVAIAADDRVGVILSFSQNDQSVEIFRDQVREILSRFVVERGTGDAALLRWIP